MSVKQILILALIVCVPLALVAWLGVRLARDEESAVRRQYQRLLIDKLHDTDGEIAGYFERCGRDLAELARLDSIDTQRLRQIVRSQPRVSQMFVIDADGQLLHPPLDAPRNESEQAFLRRAQQFLLDKDLVRMATSDDPPSPAGKTSQQKSRTIETPPPAKSQGWYVWYWGRGLNLIFWKRDQSGRVVGVELDRSRWLSELIAELPQTVHLDEVPATASRIRLVDSGDKVVYQWGSLEPGEGTAAIVETPLRAPLSSWRLKYFVDQSQLATGRRSRYFNLFSALAVVGIGLGGLAVYLYRESSRELREARTRVNFVNQVSHELKTPLTNIRMYAELLDGDLAGLDEKDASQSRERLQVIVSESGRLSRLITNVLTFAQLQRKQVVQRLKPGRVDEVIRRVIERFEPAMAQKQIAIQFDAGAGELVQFDSDALEQILVNLLSNVEKYASEGRLVEIASSQQGDRTTITVGDHGPGIEAAMGEKVFLPFCRVSNKLEGVAGAGIGLAIARNLARIHSGDVRLVSSERGAKFQIELHAPACESKEAP